jgi:UDP-N-acetylmuramoyl-tripeptide--D-alanyl-D-alanine ligase
MKIEELYNCFLQCSSISTDTRKIETGSLFVALKGANFDANTFAAEALTRGARYVVIDNPQYQTDERMLLVDDSLQALQQLASYHRVQLGLPVIALTGSNGKTTTKELINAVLSQKYTTKATVGNLNNHIGVPLTLLSFTNDTEIGIVEMGANHQKEIELLCEIAQPNFGYITNFGKAHLEGFGGAQGVIKGKSELYDYLEKHQGTAFVNLDDPIQQEKTKALPRLTFAIDAYDCDVRIETVEAKPMVTIKYDGVTIASNLIGIYNANNVNAAIAIGNFFKVGTNKIKDAIEQSVPTSNRSQIIEKNGNKIILDAYNANPSSMDAAIFNLVQLTGSKVAVIGDMFELGAESIAEHKKVVENVAEKHDILAYFIGPDYFVNKVESPHLFFFADYKEFEQYIKSIEKFINKTILIKGSRGMALERVLELL